MQLRRNALFAVMLALGISMSAGSSAGAPLHPDPAADDNLRIYTMIDTSKVTLVVDGAAWASTEGQSVMFAKLTPGPHK